MRAGGQYITPRHIVRLMTALAETKGQTVADFACGSGGLLIHSQGSKLVGVDISPEWARLARANLQLHKQQGDIRAGNALRVVKSGEKFACVVMNPPFGAKIKSDFGGRSETALINLALNHLESGGRAALLAPSGVLFSGSSAEDKLRRRLVDEVTLEAILTLPDDAFQPYSTLTTHLLLIENTPPAEKGCTWFLHPVYDGYVSGRGRDLTADPKTPNDLTLVEKAVAAFRQPPAFQPDTPLTVQPLSEDGTLLGFLLRPAEEASLLSVRHLPAQAAEPALFLLEVQHQEKRTFWKFASQALPALEEAQDAEKLVRERLGFKPKDPLPPPNVFQAQTIRWGSAENQTVGGLMIKAFAAEQPQLMGVAIPQTTLRARGYTLQPEDYLRPPEIRAELRRPHDILLEIHQRQQMLGQRMNRLAGWLTPQRFQEHTIPSKVDIQPPPGRLSDVQGKIWQVIEGFKEGESARPFTAAEIAVECTESEKRLALEIFEAMGLIVPVTLKNPENDQWLNFYRLAESNDRWTGEEEGKT
jgi:type I restriction-modification system DNA methylase subunit